MKKFIVAALVVASATVAYAVPRFQVAGEESGQEVVVTPSPKEEASVVLKSENVDSQGCPCHKGGHKKGK